MNIFDDCNKSNKKCYSFLYYSHGICTQQKYLHSTENKTYQNKLVNKITITIKLIYRCTYIMFDIFVINLEERKDRWDKIQNVFKNFNLIRINAIKKENGVIGCFLSHLKCIKIGKEKKLNSIFVIEDDCIPFYNENNLDERLNSIKNILDTYDDWDIFLGCVNKFFSQDVIGSICIENKNFVKIKKGHMTNMICYNCKCYDFFLNINPDSGIPIDVCWNGKLTAIVPVPFIAAQEDDFSNIANAPISYRGRTMTSNNSFVKYVKDNNKM